MDSLVHSTKCLNKNKHSFFILFQKIEDNNSWLILWRQYYHYVKMRQRHDKKAETNISYEYKYKDILNKILANKTHWNMKRTIHHNEVVFISGLQSWFNIQKLIKAILHINRLKKKSHFAHINWQKRHLAKSDAYLW